MPAKAFFGGCGLIYGGKAARERDGAAGESKHPAEGGNGAK